LSYETIDCESEHREDFLLWNMKNTTSINRACALSVLLLVVLSSLSTTNATITVTETQQRYASRQDHLLGRKLWKGYEYPARLQYIDGNLPMCPDDNDDGNNKAKQSYNITVPADGLPVALLVRQGGCSLQAKAEFVQHHVNPPGLVKYLIIDGTRRTDSSIPRQMTAADRDKNELSYDDDLMDEWIKRNTHRHSHEPDPDDDDELPFYVLHVSYHTEYDLLDTLLHQSPESKAAGGPRVSIDSRLGKGNLSGTAVLWIAVSALLSACACSLLLFAGGHQTGWLEEHAPPPTRPTRRRLTREQVKRLLPNYHFDGQCLQFIQQGDQENTEESADIDGLISAAPPTPTTDLELEMCSICLDEYEAGDRLRCLPCNHVFHSKCIGRWLVERSATCPLCKTDLWEEDADEESEGSVVDGHEGAALAAAEQDMQDVQTWLERVFGVEQSAPSAQPEEVTAVATEAPLLASWWRRMFAGSAFPVDTPASEALTEPLLQSVDEEVPTTPLVDVEALETTEAEETIVPPEASQEPESEEVVTDATGLPPRQVSV
jgi:hypothetical protein